MSFCAHTVARGKYLVILDCSVDERFKNNPLVVKEPNIRFYVGVPLLSPDGFILGTLSIMDQEPRLSFTEPEKELLNEMAMFVVEEMELRKMNHELNTEVKKAETDSGIKSDFVWKISREIKSPLSAIMGNIDILLMQKDKMPETDSVLDLLKSSSLCLNQLISGISDLSNIERNVFHLKQEVFDIKSVIKDVILLARPSAQCKGVSLQLNGTDEDGILERRQCFGDQLRIR